MKHDRIQAEKIRQTKESTPHKLDGVIFPIFTLEQVKKINEEILKNKSSEPEPPEDTAATTKIGERAYFGKSSVTICIPCVPLMELLHPWLYQCQLANKEIFGFDIFWDFHLDYFNYNVYEINGEYNWHIDANSLSQPLDMKLTCLLNLSEETYEGGEFCVINSDEKIEFTSGMGLIINSMLAHRVTPVTKGKRKTLTYWGLGPSWR